MTALEESRLVHYVVGASLLSKRQDRQIRFRARIQQAEYRGSGGAHLTVRKPASPQQRVYPSDPMMQPALKPNAM